MKKKELAKLKKQLGIKATRGETFVGIRPVVFADRSKYKRSVYKKIPSWDLD